MEPYEIRIKKTFLECITKLVENIDKFKMGVMDGNTFRLQFLIIASKYLAEYDDKKLNMVDSFLSNSLIEFNDTMLRAEALIPDFIKYGKAGIDVLSNEVERCISSFFYSVGGYLNSEDK